jgi:hypothetical protein
LSRVGRQDGGAIDVTPCEIPGSHRPAPEIPTPRSLQNPPHPSPSADSRRCLHCKWLKDRSQNASGARAQSRSEHGGPAVWLWRGLFITQGVTRDYAHSGAVGPDPRAGACAGMQLDGWERQVSPALPVTCFGVGPFLKVNAVSRVQAHGTAGLFLCQPSVDPSAGPVWLRSACRFAPLAARVLSPNHSSSGAAWGRSGSAVLARLPNRVSGRRLRWSGALRNSPSTPKRRPAACHGRAHGLKRGGGTPSAPSARNDSKPTSATPDRPTSPYPLTLRESV